MPTKDEVWNLLKRHRGFGLRAAQIASYYRYGNLKGFKRGAESLDSDVIQIIRILRALEAEGKVKAKRIKGRRTRWYPVV